MSLVSSGALRLKATNEGFDRSIMYEVEYGQTGVPYRLSEARQNADPPVTIFTETLISDFYGHTQVAQGDGRIYVSNYGGKLSYVWNIGQLGDAINDNEVLKLVWTDENGATRTISLRDSAAGSSYVSSDEVGLDIYRRVKQTNNTWGTAVATWSEYTSQTYSCDFNTYDYHFDLIDVSI